MGYREASSPRDMAIHWSSMSITILGIVSRCEESIRPTPPCIRTIPERWKADLDVQQMLGQRQDNSTSRGCSRTTAVDGTDESFDIQLYQPTWPT